MCSQAIAFQIRCSSHKRNTPSSLMTLCLNQLSTDDLHMIRRQIMLVC
jgi:hypothetical protein